MIRFLYALIIFAVGVACQQSTAASGDIVESNSAIQKSPLVTPDEFQSKMSEPNTIVLDVRTPGEVAQGVISGAQVIDFKDSDFKQKLAGLDKDKTYLVYCAAGGRSKSTQDLMSQMGFKDVYDLKGGIRAWNKEGKEIVQQD